MMTMLLGVAAALALQGTIQPASVPATIPKGEIRGRVTDKDSGQPLARASVRLDRVGADSMFVQTDQEGFFRFDGLAAGQYGGLVQAGGFYVTHLPQPLGNASGSPRQIVLSDGETREINVALPRALAIMVRVVDAWGDPLSGIQVTAKAAAGGPGALLPLMQYTTDDRGRLRVFGLTPGDYVVCAEAEGLGVSASPGVNSRPEVLTRTCYPSESDETQAQVVRVDRADVGELEIRMRRGRTFSLSGRILDASGAPAAGAFASLSQFRINGSSGRGISVDADGQFAIPNIQPGEYAIEASLGGPYRPEQRRPLEIAFVPIRVDASDLTGLIVPMKKGVEVAGRVVLEDAAASLPRAPGSGLMVHTRLADERLPGNGSGQSALVRADRTFVLTGIVGRRTVGVWNVPRGWYVKSIRYLNREITAQPTEFKDGTDPSALEVLLSSRGASVAGRVEDDRGRPVARALVLMFRADGDRSDVRLISSTSSSAEGTFRLGPARGGDYLIAALPPGAQMVQDGEWQRVGRLAAAAHRISLGDFDERTLDLRVIAERE